MRWRVWRWNGIWRPGNRTRLPSRRIIVWHAIQDMQVGHTLLVPADEPDGVGMERQMLVECGMEVEADALLNHMREGDVCRKKPEAAQVVDNKVFGDEDLFVVYWVFGFGFQLVGSYY
ncbi:hypothetical protein AAHE18_09G095000 [Arachis hypogaea]